MIDYASQTASSMHHFQPCVPSFFQVATRGTAAYKAFSPQTTIKRRLHLKFKNFPCNVFLGVEWEKHYRAYSLDHITLFVMCARQMGT